MPLIELPEGKGYLRVPAGLTDEQALSLAKGKFPFLYKDLDRGIIGRAGTAAVEGIGQVGETGKGLSAGIQSLFGGREGVQKYIDDQKKELEESGKKPRGITFQNLIDQGRTDGILPALSNVPAYLTEQLLQQAPSMAVPLAAGVATTALSSPLLGPFAPLAGTLAGMGTYGLQSFAANTQRQAQTPGRTAETMEPGTALGAAAVAAPIGFLVDRWTLGLGKVPTKAAAALMEKELAARGVGKTLAVGAAKGLLEVPTELLETALERAQAGLSLTDKDAKAEFLETLGSALAVGPTAGAGFAYRQRGQAQAAGEEASQATAMQDRNQARMDALKQEQEKQAEQEAFKKSPEYSAQLFQERFSLVERIKEINSIFKAGGKDLDPDDKKELKAERKATGTRLSEINKALKEVGAVPPPATGKKSALQIQEEMRLAAQKEAADKIKAERLKAPPQADMFGTPVAGEYAELPSKSMERITGLRAPEAAEETPNLPEEYRKAKFESDRLADTMEAATAKQDWVGYETARKRRVPFEDSIKALEAEARKQQVSLVPQAANTVESLNRKIQKLADQGESVAYLMPQLEAAKTALVQQKMQGLEPQDIEARRLFEIDQRAREQEGSYFQPGMFDQQQAKDPYVKAQQDYEDSIEAAHQKAIVEAKAAAEKEAKKRGLITDDYGNVVSGKEAQRLGFDIAAAEKARTEKLAPAYETTPEKIGPATAEEIAKYKAKGLSALGTEVKEVAKPQVQQDIDTGYLTLAVREKLGISLPERKEEGGAKATGAAAALQKATGVAPKPGFEGYNLNQFDQAQEALPYIQERIRQLSKESRDLSGSESPVVSGRLTKAGKKLLEIESDIKDLERLKKVAQDAPVKETEFNFQTASKRVAELKEDRTSLESLFEPISRLRMGETQEGGDTRSILGTRTKYLNQAQEAASDYEAKAVEEANLQRQINGGNALDESSENALRAKVVNALNRVLSSTTGPLEKNRQMSRRIEKILPSIKNEAARKALLDAKSLFDQNKTARAQKKTAKTLITATENLLKGGATPRNIVVLREAVQATASFTVKQTDYAPILASLDARINTLRKAKVASNSPALQTLLKEYASVFAKQKENTPTAGRGISTSEKNQAATAINKAIAEAATVKRGAVSKGPFGLNLPQGGKGAELRDKEERGAKETSLGMSPESELALIQKRIKELIAIGAKRSEVGALTELLSNRFTVKSGTQRLATLTKEVLDKRLADLSALEGKLLDRAGAGELPRFRGYLVNKIDSALSIPGLNEKTIDALQEAKDWFASGRGARGTKETRAGETVFQGKTQQVAYETTTRGTLEAANDLVNDLSLGQQGDIGALKEALKLEKNVVQENSGQQDLFVAPGREEKQKTVPGQPSLFTAIKRASPETFRRFQKIRTERGDVIGDTSPIKKIVLSSLSEILKATKNKVQPILDNVTKQRQKIDDELSPKHKKIVDQLVNLNGLLKKATTEEEKQKLRKSISFANKQEREQRTRINEALIQMNPLLNRAETILRQGENKYLKEKERISNTKEKDTSVHSLEDMFTKVGTLRTALENDQRREEIVAAKADQAAQLQATQAELREKGITSVVTGRSLEQQLENLKEEAAALRQKFKDEPDAALRLAIQADLKDLASERRRVKAEFDRSAESARTTVIVPGAKDNSKQLQNIADAAATLRKELKGETDAEKRTVLEARLNKLAEERQSLVDETNAPSAAATALENTTRNLSSLLTILSKSFRTLTRSINFISRGGSAGYQQALKATRLYFGKTNVNEDSNEFKEVLLANLNEKQKIVVASSAKSDNALIATREKLGPLLTFGESGVSEQSSQFTEALAQKRKEIQKEINAKKTDVGDKVYAEIFNSVKTRTKGAKVSSDTFKATLLEELKRMRVLRLSEADKKLLRKLRFKRTQVGTALAKTMERADRARITRAEGERYSFEDLDKAFADIEAQLKAEGITLEQEKRLNEDRRDLQNLINAVPAGLAASKRGGKRADFVSYAPPKEKKTSAEKLADRITKRAESQALQAAKKGEPNTGTEGTLDEDSSDTDVSEFKTERPYDPRGVNTTDTGVDAKEAADVVARIKAALPAGVDFIYAPTLEQVPADLRAAMAAQGHAAIKGAVLPDGRVVVVGEAHTSIADLQDTISHELIGHYGVDVVLGKDGVQALTNKLFAKGNEHVAQVATGLDVFDDVETAMRSIESASPEAQDAIKTSIVREMIAHAAEGARVAPKFADKVIGFIKDVIASVRGFFRSMGMSSAAKMDTKEIQALIKEATRALASGRLGAYTSPTGTVAFKAKMPAGFEAVQDFAAAAIAKQKGMLATIKSRSKKQNALAFKVSAIDRLAAIEEMADQAIKAGNSNEAMQMMYFLEKQLDMLSMASASAYTGALDLIEEKGEFRVQAKEGASLRTTDQALKPLTKMGFNAEGAENLFTAYMASLRGDQEGYNKLNFSPEVIKMAQEVVPNIKANPKVKDVLDLARAEYNEYNKGQIRFLEKTGAITPELAAELTQKKDFIPYYRDVGGQLSLFIGSGTPIKLGDLKNQPHLQKLVGGDEKIMSYFESSMQNTLILTDLSLRNLATKNTAHAFHTFGVLETTKGRDGKEYAIRPGDGPANANVLHFKDKGVEKHVVVKTEGTAYEHIPTELLVKGMEGTAIVMPKAIEILSIPAQVLRKGITLNPLYPYYQLVKDSNAMGVTRGVSFSSAASVLKGIKQYINGGDLIKELQSKGVIFQAEMFTGTMSDVAKIRNRLVEGEGTIAKFVARQEARAVEADGAVRAMLYSHYIKEGLSPRDAEYMTIKAMPYSRRGLDPALRYLSQMVPFFNAQIVGLYSLYQSMRGQGPMSGKLQIKKKLYTAGIGMAVNTLIYSALVSGEDWYENMPLETRLRNWLIKLPGVAEPIAIPIPFEFGIIFKSFFEATYMGMFNGTPEGKKVKEAFTSLLIGSVPKPFPTAVVPLVSIWANKDSFTGNPIEGQRELGVDPAERFRDTTSEQAKKLGRLAGVSPMQIDYLIRGYTGTVGPAVIALVDALTDPAYPTAGVKQELPASKMPLLSQIFKPVDGGALIDLAVDSLKEADQTRKTYEKLANDGRYEEAEAYLEKNQALIERGKLAGKLRQRLGLYATAEREIKAYPVSEMSPKDKREALEDLKKSKIQEAKAFMQEFRTGG